MTRLLFVTPAALTQPRGGRAMLARVHADALADLLGDRLAVCRLSDRVNGMQRLAGYLDGASQSGIARVVAAVDTHDAEAVWLDGSNLGRIAEALRRRRPQLRILSFCHNVEAQFFLGAFCRQPSPYTGAVVTANFLAERLAVRSSDDVVALSARDSAGLRRLYGRPASAILPMALRDQLSAGTIGADFVDRDAPLLFIGGAFYANEEGIEWYARQVAATAPIVTEVVGFGMEALGILKSAPGIRLIGGVDQLQPHYLSARAAVAPIFSGSGMKTKVAEAIMFGKRVIGTREAFSGYESIADQVGWTCATPAEFCAAILAVQAVNVKVSDPEIRAIYEREYSPAAVKRRLADILSHTPQLGSQ